MQMSINSKMDKLWSIHKVLDSTENKMWTTTIYNNIKESCKHNVKPKKPDTKEFISYDSTYIKFKTKLIHAVKSQDSDWG